MSVKLMDCTLRDGGNVVGKGFNAEITDLVLDGLTSAGVPIVELGNAGGIGAYEVAGFTKAETDETYLKIAQKYMGRGTELGIRWSQWMKHLWSQKSFPRSTFI